MNIPLGGYSGEPGEVPILTDTEVVFNGVGEDEYETFAVQLDESKERMAGYGFCKTAYRPYDLAVKAACIIFNHHMGDDFTAHADGSSQEDFDDARKAVQTHLGYGQDFVAY